MLEVTNLREYLNIDSCFNPNSNCFYLKRLELVLQPELLLRGEPHPDLPDERNGRRPEEWKFSNVPDDVRVEEIDHFVEDVNHVVDVDLSHQYMI